MNSGWSQILSEAQALLALEAMEIQVAFALAAAIVFIMFFEGVWAVFRLPRRAIFSLFRPWASRTQSAIAKPAIELAHRDAASGHLFVPAKAAPARNRKRMARVKRRRFKPYKPNILKNTKIEPWLLADPVLELQTEVEAPLRHPNAV